MPVLDARALEKDPKGAAFLLGVLRRPVSSRATSEAAFATRPLGQTGKTFKPQLERSLTTL